MSPKTQNMEATHGGVIIASKVDNEELRPLSTPPNTKQAFFRAESRTSAAGRSGAYAWCQPSGCSSALSDETATDRRLRTLHVTTTGRSHMRADRASSTLSELRA